MRYIPEITRHFTVSCYIVFENKVLLHRHKRYGTYLPVGGHIDRDETPEEAIIREIKEESGLDVEIVSSKLDTFEKEKSIELNMGFAMNMHYVNDFHQHMNFTYIGKSLTDKTNPNEGESTDFIWASLEEIDKMDLAEDVKKYCKFALNAFI